MYDQSKDAYKVVMQGGSLPLSGIGYVMELHLNSAAKRPQGRRPHHGHGDLCARE